MTVASSMTIKNHQFQERGHDYEFCELAILGTYFTEQVNFLFKN
jgi:hypothetical protein